MLLGAARLLKEQEKELKGTVKLLFQAAEEAFIGSHYYVDHGYLEGIDAAMGMHVWPTGPAGQVLIKDGELMASCDNFKITVHGVSTHGSMPHLGKDAIVAASSILLGLQHIVSRVNDPLLSLIHIYINLFNTYTLLIIAGTIKYIPFASRSALNSMLQISNEIEEAAIIQDIPWTKRMFRIIIPIQKSAIISGYMLPFMTCLRELSLFLLLCTQGFILSTTLDYFDEMGLYAFSSAINLILIVTILIFNTLVNKLTGASLDDGIGGN